MPSEGMREAILNFAKRYGDFSAEQHLAENMTLRLKQMADYLPKSWRGQLMELTARLENGLQAGSRTENLKLLQERSFHIWAPMWSGPMILGS